MQQTLTRLLQQQNLTTPRAHSFQHRFIKLLILRRASECVMVALLQYVGLILSGLGTSHPNLLWPASGLAVALIFLRGPRACLGIGVGSVVYYTTQSHTLLSTLLLSSVPVGFAWLSYAFIHKVLGAWVFFNKLYDLALFCLILCLTSLLSSTATSMLVQHTFSYGYWFSECSSVLLFAPLYLILNLHWPARTVSRSEKLSMIIRYGALTSLALAAFFAPPGLLTYATCFATLPIILSCRRAYGHIGAVIATLVGPVLLLCFSWAELGLFSKTAWQPYAFFIQTSCLLNVLIVLALYTQPAQRTHPATEVH